MDIAIPSTSRPRLSRRARMEWDAVREQNILLAPEGVIVLNPTGVSILELCDGERRFSDVMDELRKKYDRVEDEEVRTFLARLAAKRLVEFGDE